MTPEIELCQPLTSLYPGTKWYEGGANLFGNQQLVFEFPNGRGASVILGPMTYGGSQGLLEIAVLSKHGNLDYTTPVTSDVLGHLTIAEAADVLKQIAALPPEE